MPTRFEKSRTFDRGNGSAEANASSGSVPSVRRSGNDIDLETPMFPVVRSELKEQVTLLRWQMSTG